jgi:hypothetical protein
MLAAVETVTKADTVWESRRHNSDVAAQATAGEAFHAASPLGSEPHPRLCDEERHRRSLVDRSGTPERAVRLSYRLDAKLGAGRQLSVTNQN